MKAQIMKPAAFALLSCFAPMAILPANAGIVSGQQAAQWHAEVQRDELVSHLQKAEVQQELIKLGVSPEMALERVAALTDAEIEAINGKLSESPAGAGALGVVGLVFVVLMVLEFVGVIDIFKAR